MRFRWSVMPFVLVISSVLLTLLGVEIVMRAFQLQPVRYPENSAEYYTNPRGYYELLRTENGQAIYGVPYIRSQQGYRLPDLNSKNSYNELGQILFLGDSFTFGKGVRYDDLLSVRLQKKLDAADSGLLVANAAKIGASVGGVVEIYEKWRSTKPKIVIYGFVLNDFELKWGVDFKDIGRRDFIDMNGEGPLGRGFWDSSYLVRLFSASYEKFLLTGKTINAYLGAFEGEQLKGGLEQLGELHRQINEDGGQLVLMVFPLLFQFQDYPFHPIHDKLKSFATERSIPHLDLFTSFSKHTAESLWASPTDQHPNELGHEIAAKELYNFLLNQKLLSKASH